MCVLMDVIHFYSLDLLIFNLFLTLNTSKRLGNVRNRRRSELVRFGRKSKKMHFLQDDK